MTTCRPPALPEPRLGAVYRARQHGRGSCEFRLWAPYASKVDLCLESPEPATVPMSPEPDGYFHAVAADLPKETQYRFRLFSRRQKDGASPLLRADPMSHFQPLGVHGPSQIMDPDFLWDDTHWQGREIKRYIIYEVHPGTVTSEGTFTALIGLLPELVDLGITALELMPVAEFPGHRNWGYDGVFPFAAHHAYGGPDGLKQLVNACHRSGLAVILDVVYNHLGPEGNYLDDFGPYFTTAYTTPWGRAINFDGPFSDPVRRFFLENARYWICDCHIDALRVDAVHGIFDFSARPFLAELTRMVRSESRRLGRRIYCIAESDLNDTKVIRRSQSGGWGFDAQWNDDFHHALHSLLTGERNGYYADFGQLSDLAKAWQNNFVYDGCHSVVRNRRHGNDAGNQSPAKFVVFSQNHDQVGNRMRGERLPDLVCLEQLKLAAACVIFSPYIPLLFMGEEYAEKAPFAYFVSHSDPGLIQAVRQGRKREFEAFQWQGEPADPQDPATFAAAKSTRALADANPRQAAVRRLYRALIAQRTDVPALANLHRRGMRVATDDVRSILTVERRHRSSRVFLVFHFGSTPRARGFDLPAGAWRRRLDTAEGCWLGPGSNLPEAVDRDQRPAMQLLPWQAILWEYVASQGPSPSGRS